MMIKIVLILVFGVPIVGLSIYFIVAAERMAREEAEREAIRRRAAEAQRYDKRRRRVRYVAAASRTGVCR